MRILHYRSDFLLLTENWISPQLQNENGIESIVLCDKQYHENSYFYHNVHPLKVYYDLSWIRPRRLIQYVERWARDVFYLKEYCRVIRLRDVHIVHAHFGKDGAYILNAARRMSVPLITSFYGFDINKLIKTRYFRNKYRQLFQYGVLFLVEGPAASISLQNIGCPSDKIRVVPLGVDTQMLQYRRRQRERSNSLNLLISGSFREKKGIPYALRAIALCCKRGMKIKVDLVGDGELRPDIKTIIRENRMNAFVTMHGYISHPRLVEKYYSNHVFVSPSITASDGDCEGGAPVSIIEAQATGMPVISSWHCDIPEVVKHGETGLLAKEKDIESLAEHIAFFYHNPEKIIAFGSRARNHVEMKYSVEKMRKRLKEVYEEVYTIR